MKNIIILTLLCSMVLLLPRCSSDIPCEPEIAVSGDSVLSIDIAMEETSRGAITSTSFENGDEVFVIVTDPTNPDPLTVTTKATYNGSSWELADKINLAGNISGVEWTQARVEVYYPYSIAANGYNSETRKIELSDILQKQDDILYGSVETDKQKPNVTVNCRHALARLTFALKNNSNAVAAFDSISVKSNGLNLLESSGTLDYEGIHVSRSGDTNNSLTYLYVRTYIPAGDTYYVDCLLAPTSDVWPKKQSDNKMMEYGSQQKIKVWLEFEMNIWENIIHFDIGATGWAAGCQYTYPVNLFKTSEPEPVENEYVDLGLPSGTKWCTHNVGATYPWEYGGYYAWGETEEKNMYTGDNYKFYNNSIGECINIGDEISGTQYDVATVIMGEPWRMPTRAQQKELIDYCTWQWMELNGVNGNMFTGPNGAQIFLPAAGYKLIEIGTGPDYSMSFYWSGTGTEDNYSTAWCLYFNLSRLPREVWGRAYGSSVRAVCK